MGLPYLIDPKFLLVNLFILCIHIDYRGETKFISKFKIKKYAILLINFKQKKS